MTGLKKWSVIVTLMVGIPAALAWPTGVAEYIHEHYQLVGSNTQWIRQVAFEKLEGIKKRRQLTVSEWRRWCTLGQQLNYWRACPPR